MSGSPFRERRYRTEEVRSVVRHALAHEVDPDDGRALTRDELAALLSDIGVSGEAAARSLDEVSAPPVESTDNEGDWLGGPKRIVYEGEIEGELADDRREDVVEIIREVLGDAGRVEALGRTVTWAPTPSANNQQRRLSVKVRVRDGRTRLRIDEDLRPGRIGAWVGFGLGGGLGFGSLALAAGKAAKSGWVAVGVWVLILAASLFAAWLVTRAISKRRKRELRKLFDKMQEEVVRGTVARARVAPMSGAQSMAQGGASAREGADGHAAAERLAEAEAAALEEAATSGASLSRNAR